MKFPPLALFLALSSAVFAAAPSSTTNPPRPRILGISHAAFHVADLAKARAYYEGFLGYEVTPQPPGSGTLRFKINDLQAIEVVESRGITPDADRAHHFALQVEDAEAMRAYLKSRGVAVPPQVAIDANGNSGFQAQDPNGNAIKFVQHLATGRNVREKGKLISIRAISPRMMHLGVIIAELEVGRKFYEDILGFKEFWRGGAGPMLSWVNYRVPDGEDYVEFMLYDKYPTIDRMRSAQHICLEVSDAVQAEALLKTRPLPEGSRPMAALRTGVNGKRQVNTFDPDGTRVEIMEPKTIDGLPRPSSTAPPPKGEPKPAGPRS
jgi:catechol 2,3-dioxygenase-like lactoylglutathione lyase family enzyme